MLKNYLLVAFRNLKRHKTYSFINIIGLSVGMSAFILIALLLDYENNCDTYHLDHDRIYRVQTLAEYTNYSQEWIQTPYTLAEELRVNYLEFEDVTVLREVWGEILTRDNEKVIHEYHGYYIEPQFFELFTVNFLHGNKKTALENENSIIITDEFAKRHFGDENPIGKTIRGEANGDLIVTAVVERWPEQSHFRPTYFVSFEKLKSLNPQRTYRENWDSWNCKVYVKISEMGNVVAINSKIRNIADTKIEENTKRLYLRPLEKLRIAARVEDENKSPMPYFVLLASFVLILASINYINLTTAKSSLREKEIGIRKVIGSNKFSLFKQFIGESIVITFISLILAFFLVEILLPPFSSIAQRTITLDYLGNWEFVLLILGIMTLVGIGSGIYPALYLSSFDPIKVIKGFTSFGNSSGSKDLVRKLLVSFQFVISISLIVITYFVFNQVNFMKSKELGFHGNDLLRIRIPNNNNPRSFDDLRLRLKENPNVLEACVSKFSPFFGNNTWEINWEGGDPQEKISSSENKVSHSFIKTYNMKMIQGRDFRPGDNSDDGYVLVNETFVKKVGWKNPIGKTINDGEFTVIGVVKDFHNTSVHSMIKPYFFRIHDGSVQKVHDVIVKVSPTNKAAVAEEVNQILKEFYPNSLFQVNFYQEKMNPTRYSIWEIVEITFGYFTFLTIIIASIGIIGLLSFSVQRKSKEIGIRKVLGASINSIYILINKDFLIIFLISIIISLPISWYVIDGSPAAYKYEMGIVDYSLPILLTGILSLAATAFISVKAALNNPVNSLKDE